MGYCITLLYLYIFYFFPQHFLYFFPEPHGHGSLGYIFLSDFTALPPNPSGYIVVDIVSAFSSYMKHIIKLCKHVSHGASVFYIVFCIQLKVKRFSVKYNQMISFKVPYKSCRRIYLK